MTFQEVINKSRENSGEFCKACPVCNGKACGSHIPGPGSKGSGLNAARNYDAWQAIHLNMDNIYEKTEMDTSVDLFGHKLLYPFMAGPVGAVTNHYGPKYDDLAYNEILIRACSQNGILGFTGDGVNKNIMIESTKLIKQYGGNGVPTIKPWDMETIKEKLALAKASGSPFIAMDIDAAGLPFLKGGSAGPKSVEQLAEICKEAEVPFVLKGILTVKGALKAKEAGAAGIVVSNHGGRVLDECPATADVLEEIADAVGGSMKILVDGGIRSGRDIFKALALGADAVMICRPFVNAVLGAEDEGVKVLIDKLAAELIDAMEMCGANTLAQIDRSMVRR